MSRRTLLPALALAVTIAACGGSQDGRSAAGDRAGEATTSAEAVVGTVDATTAVTMIEERDDLTVIDVRTPEEHAGGHVAGAELLDLAGGEFERRVGDLDPDGAYLLYCRTGNRSGQAAAMMADLGFSEVHDAGAYDALADAGAPVATG